ncbi:hypothetical protein [Flavobacterium aestivum]|uniref:hypothetical protein n=1 Tax=Flavobacterium aestivum TaxID=3003257 RepID=UPI002285B50D|nr:hypothetical protein [Flavobacterium aestivum]
MKYLLSTLLFFCLVSCGTETKETYDPKEAFELWSYEDVPDDIKVINGQFWKSSHWTEEYITYLKFKASDEWIDNFIETNDLETATGDFSLPNDAPNWFTPKVGQKAYVEKEHSEGSIYFVDEKSGEVLLYEIQM